MAFVWTLRTWAERATGDDTINAELYHRFVDPLRTPVVAIVCIALVVLGPVAGAARRLQDRLGDRSSVASPPCSSSSPPCWRCTQVHPTITTVIVVVGALAILVAGIISAFQGDA